MRAQRLLFALPFLLVVTGCAGNDEQESASTTAPPASSSPTTSSASPEPTESESSSDEPERLTAAETCDELAGHRGGLALDVMDFAVDFYQDEITGDQVWKGAEKLIEKGDKLREVAHPDYRDALDQLMKEPEEMHRVAESGGGSYTMPMQEVVQSVTGAATDCYEGEPELADFVDDLTPILSRIPEYAELQSELEGDAEASTSSEDATATPAAEPEPTPTPEPTQTSAAETTAAAPAPQAGAVPREYQSALSQAYQYEEIMHMSKKDIYDQLVSEYGGQFSAAAAQYAIDNMTDVDWKANALASAQQYQDIMNMSPAAIYDQLVSEYGAQFTPAEAQYAIDNLAQ